MVVDERTVQQRKITEEKISFGRMHFMGGRKEAGFTVLVAVCSKKAPNNI